MGKKNRPKRAKKHKAKRADRRTGSGSLAYHGNKYKTKDLAQIHFHAEVGIYESFVMTDRTLTDRTVTSAVEKLILQMRKGPLPELGDTSTVSLVKGEEEDFVVWNIRRNLQQLSETEPRATRDNVIGVLRTILGSVEVWRSASPTSRGYLRYIEGFLQKAGVCVEAYPPDSGPPEEPEEEDLLLVGRAWCHEGDPEAACEFRERAEYLLHCGEAQRVAEVCQQLLGQAPDLDCAAELSALAIQAQESLHMSMG